ncbi:MAG: elongation factor G [Candidatus Cloacimonetes bacterium]|nr:elongation factor G [Candidatus Cloacimonadota bacterium]
MDTHKLRNIGISAHIDSGKTTLTERILFYCRKIHRIGEVKGKDGVGATMDSMELEKERGITISSATTNVSWKKHQINIIDTPGHVDFTVEVENALRVLDGAILVLCSVGGVQSQSFTVDRQMKRYGVPRLAFVNKCDRVGANPEKVKEQLCEKLGHNAVLMQIPIGLGNDFQGIIDLVTMRAYFYEGENNEIVLERDIPADKLDYANEKREELLDAASMFCDDLAEAFLEGNETHEMIYEAVRAGTISRELTPVFIGSAIKNKGVRLLLDAVLKYLPNPHDMENTALSPKNEVIPLVCEDNKPTVGLAFKLENQQYGQLTYLRIYQGVISKGSTLINRRTNKKIKVGRLVKMHAASMEDITSASAGDIVALFGVDCALGDTFTDSSINCSLKSTFTPEPIISLALIVADNKSKDALSKALNRFTKEDPTFKTFVDEETGETIISGMGELHLNVYVERMRREYGVSLDVGAPRVAYRETLAKTVNFDYTHKKQSGGRGQYARVVGVFESSGEDDNVFVDEIKGGVIPHNFMQGCEKGFKSALVKGALTGFPIIGTRITLNDGHFHPVDSSMLAFEIAVRSAFRQIYSNSNIRILEPVMKLSIETPSEFRSNIIALINQRRGLIVETIIEDDFTKVEAEIPLSETFGFATVLRSASQGKSDFSMEFYKYKELPLQLAEELIKNLEEDK